MAFKTYSKTPKNELLNINPARKIPTNSESTTLRVINTSAITHKGTTKLNTESAYIPILLKTQKEKSVVYYL
ncbi:hypothetical protein [Helicobacter ganmani]|uniref:hypothetical protein n=1 Tax=Helicobacter ganmani TaxID=60246 RepID=UPI003A886B34